MKSPLIIGRLVASFLETSALYSPLLQGEGVGGEVQVERIKRRYDRVWYYGPSFSVSLRVSMDREAYLRSQLEAYPEDPFWPHTLGVWLMGQSRWEEAEKAFQEALRRSPTYAAAYYQLGLLYEQWGHTEAAISAFREGEKLSADQRDLRLLRDFRAKLSLYLGIDEL